VIAMVTKETDGLTMVEEGLVTGVVHAVEEVTAQVAVTVNQVHISSDC